MSTLTTRIAGYKLVIRPATDKEISEHQLTCVRMGWLVGNYSHASVAKFESESGDWRDLPYELRSTVMTVNPEMLLDVMAAHVEELKERTIYAAENHVYDCDCDNCRISLAMMDREHAVLRGNQWRVTQRKYSDPTYTRRTGRRAGYAWENM